MKIKEHIETLKWLGKIWLIVIIGAIIAVALFALMIAFIRWDITAAFDIFRAPNHAESGELFRGFFLIFILINTFLYWAKNN